MINVIRKISLITVFNLIVGFPASYACELCKQSQPKPLQNITHGTGPQSDWDYAIIMIGIIIVSLTLFYSLKFLIKPGEKNSNHIKNIVVDEEYMMNHPTGRA